VQVGQDASAEWQEGDRVFSTQRSSHLTGALRKDHVASGLGLPLPGVLAEYRVFPAQGLVRVPDYMSLAEACTLTIAGVTAWMALNWDMPIGQPRRGSEVTVLFQGTGGVSIAGLQQAKALGLTSQCRATSLLFSHC
jgi:NADPH:quinone reductase-like Zn-dependent oxidoreductase